jgi:hypothetical protein
MPVLFHYAGVEEPVDGPGSSLSTDRGRQSAANGSATTFGASGRRPSPG